MWHMQEYCTVYQNQHQQLHLDLGDPGARKDNSYAKPHNFFFHILQNIHPVSSIMGQDHKEFRFPVRFYILIKQVKAGDSFYLQTVQDFKLQQSSMVAHRYLLCMVPYHIPFIFINAYTQFIVPYLCNILYIQPISLAYDTVEASFFQLDLGEVAASLMMQHWYCKQLFQL